jgi:hypothetical protein
MDEFAKLLATRRDARVAVIGPADAVARYLGETEKNLDGALYTSEQGAAILFFRDGDGLVGPKNAVADDDGPVVLAAASVDAIPRELRKGLVVVKAPTERRWRRRRPD